MDEGETKICENCKREIPAVNFTIHAVHCMRNIRICPVCKEPVQNAELQQHHDKMHKLSPCKQCGESVCGTDMEDHVRDSCAQTMKSCKFCLLELRRGALPAHERYCGARTELCECGEWVMHKYRALHLDSNHGFVRLHDDPEPVRAELAANAPPPPGRPQPPAASSAIKPYRPDSLSFLKNVNNTSRGARPPAPAAAAAAGRPSADVRNAVSSTGSANAAAGCSRAGAAGPCGAAVAGPSGTAVAGPDRVADSGVQNGAVPSPNIAPAAADRVQKNLWAMGGAVKKRPAPKPPASPPAEPPAGPREVGLQRRRQEEERCREQPARNLSAGRATGGAANQPAAVARNLEARRRNDDLKNLKPMTPQEFMERFDELQLMQEPREEPARNADRFGQIKSSLRELRRGLNEVTAPYGSGAGADANHNAESDDEQLPCEFCGEAVPADDLVMHETGCRPDLAQYWPPGAPGRGPYWPPAPPHVWRTASPMSSPSPLASPAASPAASPPASPLIPCEFCTAPLPVYLVSEHQERCGRDAEVPFQD